MTPSLYDAPPAPIDPLPPHLERERQALLDDGCPESFVRAYGRAILLAREAWRAEKKNRANPNWRQEEKAAEAQREFEAEQQAYVAELRAQTAADRLERELSGHDDETLAAVEKAELKNLKECCSALAVILPGGDPDGEQRLRGLEAVIRRHRRAVELVMAERDRRS